MILMPHAYETGWRSNGFRPYSDYTLKLFSIVLPFANPSVIISLMSSTRTPQNAPLINVLEGFSEYVRSLAPRAPSQC